MNTDSIHKADNAPLGAKTKKRAPRLPKDIDPECFPLCKAMNSIPGIETIESCCGHGKDNFRIWFIASDLDCLPNLLYWFDVCHTGFSGWRAIVRTDCAKSPVYFCVEGPIGMDAYEQSNEIAKLIENGTEFN